MGAVDVKMKGIIFFMVVVIAMFTVGPTLWQREKRIEREYAAKTTISFIGIVTKIVVLDHGLILASFNVVKSSVPTFDLRGASPRYSCIIKNTKGVLYVFGMRDIHYGDTVGFNGNTKSFLVLHGKKIGYRTTIIDAPEQSDWEEFKRQGYFDL